MSMFLHPNISSGKLDFFLKRTVVYMCFFDEKAHFRG